MKMKGKLKRRLISFVISAVVAFTSVISSPIYTAAENTPDQVDGELCLQSFELYPNGVDAEEVVTLEGLMPEGASAEAIDVSAEHGGIVAYDITITDSENNEFQPEEDSPVLVEITAPAIPDSEGVELWHIKDNGEREQVFDFTLEQGKITFYATGFSVYEIVENAVTQLDFFESLAEHGNKGFTVSFIFGEGKTPGNNGPYYLKGGSSEISGQYGRKGIDLTSNEASAIKLYFEKADDNAQDTFYFYVMDGNNKKYIKGYTGSFGNTKRSALDYVDSKSEATVFVFNPDGYSGNMYKIYATLSDGKKYYWVADKGSNVQRIVGYEAREDANVAWISIPGLYNIYDELDGQTYGLMYRNSNSSIGYAIGAGNDNTIVAQLTMVSTRSSIDAADNRVVYVPSSSDASMWTFVLSDEDKYYLKTTVGGADRFLASDGTALSLVSDPSNASQFRATPNADHTIMLFDTNGRFVTFDGTSYVLSDTPSPLFFLKKTTLTEDEQLTYTADRISVSDGEKACDGQKVIVYTRIWDDTDKRYDFYAINYDGTLYPCYAYGDKLMWMGNAMNTLLWDLTVYHNADGSETGYYELQNVYSEQYLAPQRDGQLLSDRKIGIQLPKRTYEVIEDTSTTPSTFTYNYGEYFSPIIAWDQLYYDYAALHGVETDPVEKTGYVTPVTYAHADDFYFAVIDVVNTDETDELHKVETINNADYGIKIRMADFGVQQGYSATSSNGSTVTWDYFNGNTANKKGLLKNGLYSQNGEFDPNGDPYVASNNLNFENAFSNGIYVDNLFIRSIHDSSGYFEFDSCQNFATLKPDRAAEPIQKTNENGEPLYITEDGKETTDQANAKPLYSFTVYRELGTVETDYSTRKHGQFLPYNYIAPGEYSITNPQNLYNVMSHYQHLDRGELSDDDPRKYEKLYTAQHGSEDPNYYFGMEMETSFVQTPSGLDAWGHDVIFEFTGDDDFWFYVDGELVLDLGGIHSAESGKVNFRTGKVEYSTYDSNDNLVLHTTTLREIFKSHYIARGMTRAQAEAAVSNIFEQTGDDEGYVFKDYTTHAMRVYYMERGAGASNLHMRFNLSAVTPGNVLFAKGMTGFDDPDVDYSMVQFPFQIQYRITEDDPWQNLTNEPGEDHKPTVSYQSSTQTVRYASTYQSPNANKIYNDVFFIIPGRNLEINFPDDAMYYRIIECAVDKDIYNVTATGEGGLDDNDLNDEPGITVSSGSIHDLITRQSMVNQQPTIAFNNEVKQGNIRSLNITKKLYADKNKTTELTAEQDDTTFNYRLYLSNSTSGELELANLVKYYVLDSNYHLCIWDVAQQKFVANTPYRIETDIPLMTEDERELYVFRTSQYGAISNIPVGYTVRVPGLVAGTKFLVQERDYEIPVGYDLLDFECKKGRQTFETLEQSEVSSYKVDDTYTIDGVTYTIDSASKLLNSAGTIVASYQAEVFVNNYRGYGIKVEKEWTDRDFVDAHGDIYTAVYVDGVLKTDSIRQIKNPNTSVKYFFDSLDSGKMLDDYTVYEVELTNPVVGADGVVTSYDSITKKESDSMISISVTDHDALQPITDDYTVSYYPADDSEAQRLEASGKGRKDMIKNTRKGGIEIDLHPWNNTDTPDTPLAGGTFVLKLGDSEIGTFTSGADGTVTVIYGVEAGQVYTLEQTESPSGYIGIHDPITFTVTQSGSLYGITMNNPNDTDDDTIHTAADGKNWAEYDSPSGVLSGKIDIYNKPYTLKVMKVQGGSDTPINGAEFALYRAVMLYGNLEKDFYPMVGYESLVSGNGVDRGVIPKIDNTLAPRKYYLTEKTPPPGYYGLSDDLIVTITNIGEVIIEGNSGYLEIVDSADHSFVTYKINVPNTVVHDYYFDIEKIAFIDKNIHSNNADTEQKFVFKVERFDEEATELTEINLKERFYVTLNCDTKLQTYPEYNNLSSFTGHLFNSTENKVTISYTDGGESTSYTFPADIYKGVQTVHVKERGIYRISEVTDWSTTDYDFWTGSNVYFGNGADNKSALGIKDSTTDNGAGDYVIFSVDEVDAENYGKDDPTNRPTASFTNCETEFAFLSAQAYAENTIKME